MVRLSEAQKNPIIDLVREARERLMHEFRAQAEQSQKLGMELRDQAEHLQRLELEFRAQAEQSQRVEQELQGLRDRQQLLETVMDQQLAAFEQVKFPAVSLESVLGAVRNLITCTMPEQVLQVLTEEAAQLGVRAAVFDVRGKAAWGAAASGFGEELSEKDLRSLMVPLNKDNPFRDVCETGGDAEVNVRLLRKNRNVLEKLKPSPQDPILLEPVRSAGAVSAIFYADPGGKPGGLPMEGLKILSEFAGAQLDRLMVLSGGITAESPVDETEAEVESAEDAEALAEPSQEVMTPGTAADSPEPWEAAVAESAPAVETGAPEPVADTTSVGAGGTPPESAVEESSAPAAERVEVEAPLVSVEAASGAEIPPSPGRSPADLDLSQLSEAEQRIHKDARRFARLLVSEIELYNKAKVADGRKNKDLYRRLKPDIDRSRQTFEKRFGRTVGRQFDYFHDELVKTLASNDPSALGTEYPEPAE